MEEPLSIQIGKRIRARREELKLTREDVAELADLSVTFISEIESGKKNMTTNTLAKVAPALSISADYIIFGSDEHPKRTEIENQLARLSKRDRQLAEELLNTFIKAVSK